MASIPPHTTSVLVEYEYGLDHTSNKQKNYRTDGVSLPTSLTSNLLAFVLSCPPASHSGELPYEGTTSSTGHSQQGTGALSPIRRCALCL